MAITVGDLLVKLGLDNSSLISGLNDSENAVSKTSKSWQDSLKGIAIQQAAMGTAIMASMTKIVQSYVSVGSELYDLSLKTGVSAKVLAGLQYAAEQNGASLGTVETAIKRVSVAMEEAKDPTSATAKALKDLGISTSDLIGLSPEEQFLKIANSIAKIPDPMSRSAMAVKIFGRSGTDLLPMLSEGADGLQKMMEKGQQLSGWTDKGAKSADALGDAFATLKTATSGVVNSLAASLAPTLQNIVDKLVPIIANIKTWIDKNSDWAKNIGIFAGALGVMATTIAAVTGAQWLWNIAMAANPIGAIILAVEALIAVGVVLALNWQKVVDFFKGCWDLIKIAFATAVKWITNTVLLPFIEFYGKMFGVITEGIGKLVGLFNKDLGQSIVDFGNKMVNARKEITDWSNSLIDSSRNAITMRAALIDLANASKQSASDMSDNIKNYTATAKANALTLADTQIAAINKALDAAQTAHDTKMGLLDDEYNATIKLIDATLGNTLSALDDQIAALQKQQQANQDAITARQNQDRIASLQSQILAETDADRKAALQKELADLLQSIADDAARRAIDDQITTLRQQEDDARTSAQTQKDIAKTAYDAEKALLDQQLADVQLYSKYEIDSANATLAAHLANYTADETAFNALLADKTKSMADFVTAYNALVGQMAATGAIPAPPTPTSPTTGGFNPPPNPWLQPTLPGLPGYASGGMIPEPTLLTSLRTMRPYAIAGEAGPERVGPAGNVFNITFPNMVIRDDRDIDKIGDMLVSRMQLRTGLKN